MTYGNNTANGFRPSHPDIQNLMQSIQTGEGGWSGFDKGQGSLPIKDFAGVNDDLTKSYKNTFGTDAGQRVLEDLLNQTLRISTAPAIGSSVEQVAMHAQRRQGQNDLACYILKMLSLSE